MRRPRDELKAALGLARGSFLAVGVFSLVINLLLLTVPIYMMQVYDRVLNSYSQDTLLMLTLLAGGLLLAHALLEALRARVLVRVGLRLDGALNARLFEAVLASRLGAAPASHGQVMRDFESLRGFLTGAGLLAFFDMPFTPLFVAVILLCHPLLGTVALGGALLLFALALLTELATRQMLGEAAERTAAAQRMGEAGQRNAEAVHAMGMTAGLRQRWLAWHETGVALQGRASDRAAILQAVAKFCRLGLQVAMLGVGALLTLTQAITPGIMIAASIIMGRALAPVEAAIGSWRQVVAARGAYRRLGRLLQEQPRSSERLSLPRPTGELVVERLTAAPPGADKLVLNGIGFTLNAGEMLGVIGPSAAGKSTLARYLVGVWRPQDGHVRLDGADLHDWPPGQLGGLLGYLPQDVELFDGTVTENIARFSDPDAALVVRAAKQANAHEMILRLTEGYQTRIGEAGALLSGGQRQRLALARALYGDPVLIVLDEPNANLDQEGEQALLAALAALKQAGKTVVVIAHRPALLAGADKLLVLRQGRVELLGPRQKVLRRLSRPLGGQSVAELGRGDR